MDPGVRNFMTGISENEVVKIGKDSKFKIQKYLERTDKYNKNPKLYIFWQVYYKRVDDLSEDTK